MTGVPEWRLPDDEPCLEPVAIYFGKTIKNLNLFQQSQYPLWQLVGLRHHGRTGLLQDL